MLYKEFLITAEPFNPDILSGFLWNLDITGISEEVNCLKIFSDSVTKNEIEVLCNKLVEDKILFSFTVEENFIEERNWNEEWEKSRDIIRITDRIVVKPTFRNYSASENEIVITVDPKMSFGTGEHQTTKLMISLAEKYIKQGMKVLDIGTGTGILAIAAVKLGASNIIAFDVDEWCFENSRENTELNDVKENVKLRICDIKDIDENEFDLIFANIQKNVLIEISSEIASRVKENGILLLSGILHIDELDILQHYNNAGFKLLEKRQADEWLAFSLCKKY